jgi:hypothetical protein
MSAVGAGQRLSEDSARLLGGRPSLEDGSSSFAALFSGGSGAGPAGYGGMTRRDSQSSLVSSRIDDLGFNLDLPGLQVGRILPPHHFSTASKLTQYM